ncbi:hypothetical protein PIB30_018106 [Stylosanthes scabra]|uniref:Integrase catalytic domain-containing protein n=1 Tax=Stylosanthes scabra TaxID=79078 RepID=A0ABU6Z5D8_9FABA|nr:hypothetical protein [Stylosanthes scabra]
MNGDGERRCVVEPILRRKNWGFGFRCLAEGEGGRGLTCGGVAKRRRQGAAAARQGDRTPGGGSLEIFFGQQQQSMTGGSPATASVASTELRSDGNSDESTVGYNPTVTSAFLVVTAAKCWKFVWKQIITRFGIPSILITDNETQFADKRFKESAEEFGINQRFCLV